jgi:hypothetical protein
MVQRIKSPDKSKRSNPAKRRVTSRGRNYTRPKRSTKSAKIPTDDRFETAYQFLREGRSQRRSAEIAGISVKRFSKFIRSNKLARFKGGRWQITDRRIREITIISEGQALGVKVRGFSPASLAMRHRAAVHHFLDSNEASLLTPFEGAVIKDITKQKHVLETRPNVLLRLANTGGDAEMKIYRLID